MMFVKTASLSNLAYLGLGLVVLYFFWGRMAQLIYGLSTYQLHTTTSEFLNFMLTTSEGQTMALVGTAVGGIIAFMAFCLVVVSAPMLLDQKTDIFAAAITSVRTVTKNPVPMLIWAVLIVALTGVGILTACLGLIVLFPVIGLATWRAYRELVPDHHVSA